MPTPIALTIAGSDSGGGAGIQADLKTFAALGVYGTSAITAVTAQNTLGVQAIHAVPAEIVAAQMTSVLSDMHVSAAKIGMLANAANIMAIAEVLQRYPALPLVLDTVLVSSSGRALLAEDALDLLRARLFPRAHLVTPNLPEAAALLHTDMATDVAGMEIQAKALHAFGCAAVLLKGGHGAGEESIDVLYDGTDLHHFAAHRIAAKNTHGTGCTLSAAVAAGLAKGLDLYAAVGAAKSYVTRAIAAADRLHVGKGNGPLQHFP
ncbi:bifunctional hydroxymethylpyrimidine kinase/phosphomethylpyrimidine kinase [Methylovirgula sp. 4M-Z18]|uniref:bifunctional hydroxymethylpyrimidine kinase/phosphomethylpyrimidine kinase n=1 Tax=Methylovirgula sp. 4M-Z18 TaxID=2293567 RepID=UPI000E2FEE4B|nr:bifunctional hydroxymethylpyrimidine kinase/phosphomethylpyrimidine kinase [Methylovirgula sp. 4M-Z18]RFB80053.1 bifunctional hydroxymethylpyrimidine kinase/phosphomethylpyrimidine kinase [Methylovirgula sp. 4M-Z18]